jgi:hypothetical protein
VGLVRIQQDVRADPGGQALSRFLAAHLRLERIVRRRVLTAQVAALLGVPLWFASLVSLPRPLVGVVISVLAVSVIALIGAITSEIACRERIREMSRHVRVRDVAD